jgi:hypothetical protein
MMPMTKRSLIALAVTGATFVAAAPAGATQNTTPVDENGKKSCEYAKFGGGTGYYPHGTKITVTLPSGASKTVECKDGTWESAKASVKGNLHYRAADLYVAPSGKLVIKNQRPAPAAARA